ncbi:MAG: peptide chain release factor-like protein [Polyangiaceae bacterium]|nr:peptide chain release factor-like protein [Polyangiaceae bacterium]
MNAWVVQVSSGTGPEEVRRFVAHLADWLISRCDTLGLWVREVITHGDESAPRSVEVIVEGDAQHLLASEMGTHALIEPSRGRSSRKRWYAGISMHALDEVEGDASAGASLEMNRADFDITAARSGGPGGQHVNKTATAVRVLHKPSGIGVRVTTERSQRANIKIALRRIAERLALKDEERRTSGRSARRIAHYRVLRGAPVRTFCVGRRGELNVARAN